MAYTYSLLASSTVGAGGASAITFNNIPQNYTDLVVKVSLRNTAADTNTDTKITFNGSTSGYSARRITGSGTAAGSVTQSPTDAIYFGLPGEGTLWTVSTFANGEMYIPNYTSSNNKSISLDGVAENNGTAAAAHFAAALWSNSVAINQITLTSGNGNWAQYTTATLYGIRVEL